MAKYQTYKLSEAEKTQYNLLIESDELKQFPKQVTKILFNRGIRTIDDIMFTLFGKMKDLHHIHMRDQREFIARLINALTYGELIVIMGDYDTDGCMATCVMVLALRKLGFRVEYYMNSRFRDGYGLKEASVDEIIKRYPDVKVIVTVDNGVKAFNAVDYCNDKGIDVLVTDHHNPGSVLPNALAVVDPKRSDCLYPFEGLCGAGVAYKLMIALSNSFLIKNQEALDYIKDLVWLVAIATVGDQVPLVDENRIMVKHALDKFNDPNYNNFFIDRIKRLLKISSFSSDTIAFYISPMINAMGRIEGNPLQIVDAIISEDADIIDNIVAKMDELNQIRKDQTSAQVETALELLEKEDTTNKGILVCSDLFTEGIIGIVASRLVEKFNKPVIVLCPNQDGTYKGSCRSVEGISIEGVLNEISSFLVNFGGHDMAAGLTILEEQIEPFKERFLNIVSRYNDELFKEVINIDLVVREHDIDLSLCNLVKELGPYGNSFRKPKFFLKDFRIDMDRSIQNVSKSVYVGKTASTLRLVGHTGLVCIGFKAVEKFKRLGEPSIINLVGEPKINEYNGKCYPQFEIEKDYVLKSQ